MFFPLGVFLRPNTPCVRNIPRAKNTQIYIKGRKMNFTLQNFFQDSELQVDFNSKLEASKFDSFVKMFKIFRLRTNANQNLILSALVEKSLKSENKDSTFLFCSKYESENLGISRSTLQRFLSKLVKLGIIVKVASKEIEAEKTINAYAFNIDKFQEFMSSRLKFNDYYKTIFVEDEEETKPSRKDIIQYLEKLVEELREEIKIRDEKIMELQKGEAIYNEAEVEALNNQNSELREKLAGITEAYEKLANELKTKVDSLAPLALENEKLKEELSKAQNVEKLEDSQEYKDLAESNRMLEDKALRVSKENEELKAELERVKAEKGNANDSEKARELEARLKKAAEVYIVQKKEIELLKEQCNNPDVLKAREDYNKMLKTQWNGDLQREKDRLVREKEAQLAEVVSFNNANIERLKNENAELKSKLKNSESLNAKGVPFTLEDFVDKVMPQIVHHLNPTQRAEVENTFKSMARSLTECYEKDPNKEPERAIKEVIEAEAEAEAAFPYIEPTNELPASEQEDSGFKTAAESMPKNDKENLTPPTWTQEDLPF